MSYKIDLHTHSILSYDGGISLDEYQKIVSTKTLDYIAITDHNEIDFALNARALLGDHIIVGEEIMTSQGEIIGLYLHEKIQPGLSLSETIKEIQRQQGLVYIPHPFDTRRHAIGRENLLSILQEVDILEVFNGRNITRGNNNEALSCGIEHSLPPGIGSDSHCKQELGRSYMVLDDIPSRNNLQKILEKGTMVTKLVTPLLFLSPSINKIKKML